MSRAPLRVEVMHGVNLDQLGRREAEHYGTVTLDELETFVRIARGGSFSEASRRRSMPRLSSRHKEWP